MDQYNNNTNTTGNTKVQIGITIGHKVQYYLITNVLQH